MGNSRRGGPLEATELIISSSGVLRVFIIIIIVVVIIIVCVTYVGSYDIASLWRSEDNSLEVGFLLPYLGSEN